MSFLKWEASVLVLSWSGAVISAWKPEIGFLLLLIVPFIANVIGFSQGLSRGEEIWRGR